MGWIKRKIARIVDEQISGHYLASTERIGHVTRDILLQTGTPRRSWGLPEARAATSRLLTEMSQEN